MKQLQVILTIDVSNDEYSLLLNKQSDLTIETLTVFKINNEWNSISLDYPALLLDLGANEPGYPEELSRDFTCLTEVS